MKADAMSLGLRLYNFTRRALKRLGFFPFTLLSVILSATRRLIQLRQGLVIVRVGKATSKVVDLPCNVMLWLDRALAGPPGHQFDVCLHLPQDAADANLQDVFSTVLTFPRFRSVGLYWDSLSLADDLPLWQGSLPTADSTGSAAQHEDLGTPSPMRLEEFFHADHSEITPPIAATRDAQTLLKRQAGRAHVVCLNVPEELWSLVDVVTRERPDIWFFDLGVQSSPPTKAANYQSFFTHGLSLHERMALVQAADAYVGSFDLMGCSARLAGRLTILLGAGSGNQSGRARRDDLALWFPGPLDPRTLTMEVLQFLSQLRDDSKCSHVE